jgi:hypothetical protein
VLLIASLHAPVELVCGVAPERRENDDDETPEGERGSVRPRAALLVAAAFCLVVAGAGLMTLLMRPDRPPVVEPIRISAEPEPRQTPLAERRRQAERLDRAERRERRSRQARRRAARRRGAQARRAAPRQPAPPATHQPAPPVPAPVPAPPASDDGPGGDDAGGDD